MQGRDKPPIRSILFLCNQNAVRSPMAKAIADRHSRRKIFCESVGLVAGQLDPFSVAAMAEENINIDDHKPKDINAVDLALFDAVIALTPESRDRIMKTRLKEGAVFEFWQTPDPAEAEGNRDHILDSYRLVRDHLEVRIADFLHHTISPTSMRDSH